MFNNFEVLSSPGIPGQSDAATASLLATGISMRKDLGEDDTTHLPDATTASTIRDQTTLIPNEAEAFALEPIDVTSLGKFYQKEIGFRILGREIETIYILLSCGSFASLWVANALI